MPWGLWLALLWTSAPAWPVAPTGTTARIASIRCPLNDQPDSRPLSGEALTVAVDAALASQIVYYIGDRALGVLAPRGWHCHAWDGPSGGIVVVTPQALMPPFFPLPKITGPAVVIDSSDAASAGRFHAAVVAARLFPVAGAEFVARVKQEHLVSDSLFDREPEADEQLRYLSDRFVLYSTPASIAGLGTDALLEPASLPVRGMAILNPDADTNTITEVQIRLPAALRSVQESIVQLETACVQLPQGCRGLR